MSGKVRRNVRRNVQEQNQNWSKRPGDKLSHIVWALRKLLSLFVIFSVTEAMERIDAMDIGVSSFSILPIFSMFCLALALAANALGCMVGNRSKSGLSLVIATSCLCFTSMFWSLPLCVWFGIAIVAAVSRWNSAISSFQPLGDEFGILLSPKTPWGQGSPAKALLPAALQIPVMKSKNTTMSATALLWKLLCAMLKRGELGQVVICLLWGMHCFVTHVLLELEDLVLDLWPSWKGEDVVVILGHPRSASTHVHHMLSQTLPTSASLTFYDVLFPSLLQWYCMYPFKPLANKFLSLLDSPQHRIAVDEVAEEQQWLLLKFKDILLPMLFPAMVDDPDLFRASCDYTEADMIFIKGCMKRLLIRKPEIWIAAKGEAICLFSHSLLNPPRLRRKNVLYSFKPQILSNCKESKLYIARMLTFSPWPQYITAAFPDAKFIVCLRSTEECLRSFVSLAAVHSGGNPHTPLCKKWAQNCADTLTQGTVRGLQDLVNGNVPDAGWVMQVSFRSWKTETRACLTSLLQKLGVKGELKSEGEEVKVERREKHKSCPNLADCLDGVTIAKWAIDDMDSMMEKSCAES